MQHRLSLLTKHWAVVLSLSVLLLLVYLTYYQFYPRYRLGYSDVKISRNTWMSAFPGYGSYASSLYYKRFDNEYNYKAYSSYRYFDFIQYMKDDAQCSFSRNDLIERISCADIADSDKEMVDILYSRYRREFLTTLENHKVSPDDAEHICRHLIAAYFLFYYNQEHHGLLVDMEEFSAVVSWLKQYDKNLLSHLEDPFNWRGCDFSGLNDHKRLRTFVSLHVSSEFLRDIESYEHWIREFRTFALGIEEVKEP